MEASHLMSTLGFAFKFLDLNWCHLASSQFAGFDFDSLCFSEAAASVGFVC